MLNFNNTLYSLLLAMNQILHAKLLQIQVNMCQTYITNTKWTRFKDI